MKNYDKCVSLLPIALLSPHFLWSSFPKVLLLFWKIHELFGKIQILLESHLILEEENIFKTMISIESNKINKLQYKPTLIYTL